MFEDDEDDEDDDEEDDDETNRLRHNSGEYGVDALSKFIRSRGGVCVVNGDDDDDDDDSGVEGDDDGCGGFGDVVEDVKDVGVVVRLDGEIDVVWDGVCVGDDEDGEEYDCDSDDNGKLNGSENDDCGVEVNVDVKLED